MKRHPTSLNFWKYTGLFGRGHVSYRDARDIGQARRNPARMIEDIMGANPTKGEAGGRWDGRSDEEAEAEQWRLEGWWD